MLRFGLFVLVALALCSGKPAKEEWSEKATKIKEECTKSTGINADEFHKGLASGSKDEKIKDYALCFGEKLEVLDDEGNMDMDKVKKHFEEDIPDKAKEISEKCLEEKENAKETAYAIAKCVWEFFPEVKE